MFQTTNINIPAPIGADLLSTISVEGFQSHRWQRTVRRIHTDRHTDKCTYRRSHTDHLEPRIIWVQRYLFQRIYGLQSVIIYQLRFSICCRSLISKRETVTRWMDCILINHIKDTNNSNQQMSFSPIFIKQLTCILKNIWGKFSILIHKNLQLPHG